MEYKSHAGEFKANIKKRELSGYASAFGNTDSYGDIVQSGAFIKTIRERKDKIKVLYQHSTFHPIGKPLEMLEDAYGLSTVSFIPDTPLGNDVLVLAEAGVLSEMSIGFDTVKSVQIEKGGRELLEVRLWEYSPVTFAANDLATITGVKNASDLEPYIRQLESISGAGLKAGRVLSQANLERMKSALQALQEILSTTEPSDDTQTDAKHNAEPQSHSTLTAIGNLKNTLALEKLSRELRSATAALRG